MKLNLLLLCLIGIVPITLSSVPHAYHLIQTPMTHSGAQNYCRTVYNDLDAIESVNDWLRIAAEALRHFMIFPAWIGLYNNVDDWLWSYTDLPLKNTTLINWQSEPASGFAKCAAIQWTGYWVDLPCTDLKPFICYDSRIIGGGRFISYPLPLLNWFGAQAFCRTFHTDLASATNSMDNNALKNKVIIFTSFWFGLYRGTWTWIDGTKASNIPWALFQPDNLFGTQNCGVFALGLISDETCTNQYAFYCHSTPPVKHQQIVRLQVKTDGSVLDQSSILEKVKQKMKENGMAMENITVNWRLQSDGNIFNKENKDGL
ncbi:uncharacterized protein LOC113643923 [Tachysurus fulvidraco]|uniref:uncharacterized protein LOC113643923 n=1 Tax=Tachysurus fulvidraco TaxID=1234273 RepID=UPI001FF003C6|nr:uncharacterized protein LOC113643923 [Tachysurus fulvidraco]